MIEYNDLDLWEPVTANLANVPFEYDALKQLYEEAKWSPIGFVPSMARILNPLAGPTARGLFPTFGPVDKWFMWKLLATQPSAFDTFHDLTNWRAIIAGAYSASPERFYWLSHTVPAESIAPPDPSGLYEQDTVRDLKSIVKNNSFHGLYIQDKYPWSRVGEIFLNESDIEEIRNGLTGYTYKPFDIWKVFSHRITYRLNRWSCGYTPISSESEILLLEATEELDPTLLNQQVTIQNYSFKLNEFIAINGIRNVVQVIDSSELIQWVGVFRTRLFDGLDNYWQSRYANEAGRFTTSQDGRKVTITVDTPGQVVIDLKGQPESELPGVLDIEETATLEVPEGTELITVSGFKNLIGTETIVFESTFPVIEYIQLLDNNNNPVDSLELRNTLLDDPYKLRISLDIPVPANLTSEVDIVGDGFAGLQDFVVFLESEQVKTIEFIPIGQAQPGPIKIAATARVGCYGEASLDIEGTYSIDVSIVPQVPSPTQTTPNPFGIAFKQFEREFIYVLMHAFYWTSEPNTHSGNYIEKPPSFPGTFDYNVRTSHELAFNLVRFWMEEPYLERDFIPLTIQFPKYTNFNNNPVGGLQVPDEIPAINITRDWQINTVYKNDFGGIIGGSVDGVEDISHDYSRWGAVRWHGIFPRCSVDHLLGGFAAAGNLTTYTDTQNFQSFLDIVTNSVATKIKNEIQSDYPGANFQGFQQIFVPTGTITKNATILPISSGNFVYSPDDIIQVSA